MRSNAPVRGVEDPQEGAGQTRAANAHILTVPMDMGQMRTFPMPNDRHGYFVDEALDFNGEFLMAVIQESLTLTRRYQLRDMELQFYCNGWELG